jgi:pimeloyl-ACP methyl ester carboxylesterase
MKILRNVLLPGPHGKPIVADVFYKDDRRRKPVVIFSHGFKGFKDWGHFDLVAKRMAEAGFVFIKFNFAYNGTTPEKLTEFADPEAFGHNNLTKELDDLGVVIDYAITDATLKEVVDTDKLYLVGHSRGGGITLLKAYEDPRVKKAVVWGSITRFGSFWNDEQVVEWKKQGYTIVENARTKQRLPMYYQYYENWLENKERLDLEKTVKGLQIPVLSIHGTHDEAVPMQLARIMAGWNPLMSYIELEGGLHTFGVKHPFTGELPADAERVIEETIRYLAG